MIKRISQKDAANLVCSVYGVPKAGVKFEGNNRAGWKAFVTFPDGMCMKLSGRTILDALLTTETLRKALRKDEIAP